jgi:hypothetical protein
MPDRTFAAIDGYGRPDSTIAPTVRNDMPSGLEVHRIDGRTFLVGFADAGVAAQLASGNPPRELTLRVTPGPRDDLVRIDVQSTAEVVRRAVQLDPWISVYDVTMRP